MFAGVLLQRHTYLYGLLLLMEVLRTENIIFVLFEKSKFLPVRPEMEEEIRKEKDKLSVSLVFLSQAFPKRNTLLVELTVENAPYANALVWLSCTCSKTWLHEGGAQRSPSVL